MLDYEITTAELAARLAARANANRNHDETGPALRVIDVREPWEHATAHIEGTILMPMGEVTSRAHTELDPEQSIVVLCHAGVRSMSVAVWLREQGFDHAQSLRGGIDAWSREIDPAVPRY